MITWIQKKCYWFSWHAFTSGKVCYVQMLGMFKNDSWNHEMSWIKTPAFPLGPPSPAGPSSLLRQRRRQQLNLLQEWRVDMSTYHWEAARGCHIFGWYNMNPNLLAVFISFSILVMRKSHLSRLEEFDRKSLAKWEWNQKHQQPDLMLSMNYPSGKFTVRPWKSPMLLVATNLPTGRVCRGLREVFEWRKSNHQIPCPVMPAYPTHVPSQKARLGRENHRKWWEVRRIVSFLMAYWCKNCGLYKVLSSAADDFSRLSAESMSRWCIYIHWWYSGTLAPRVGSNLTWQFFFISHQSSVIITAIVALSHHG